MRSRTISEPAQIAEAIHEAATDGTDRLRYVAGADGIRMLAERAAARDEEHFARVRDQFGLTG